MNRYESGQAYIPYTSTTAKASVGQPTVLPRCALAVMTGHCWVWSTAVPGSVHRRYGRFTARESNLGLIFLMTILFFHYDTFLTPKP